MPYNKEDEFKKAEAKVAPLKVDELAKTEEAKQLKFHTDARDARVLAIKNTIAAEKVARDEQETKGIVETEGAKLDRLAKEAKDLREANRVNVIEPFGLNTHNLEVQGVSNAISSIISFLNGSNLNGLNAVNAPSAPAAPVKTNTANKNEY